MAIHEFGGFTQGLKAAVDVSVFKGSLEKFQQTFGVVLPPPTTSSNDNPKPDTPTDAESHARRRHHTRRQHYAKRSRFRLESGRGHAAADPAKDASVPASGSGSARAAAPPRAPHRVAVPHQAATARQAVPGPVRVARARQRPTRQKIPSVPASGSGSAPSGNPTASNAPGGSMPNVSNAPSGPAMPTVGNMPSGPASPSAAQALPADPAKDANLSTPSSSKPPSGINPASSSANTPGSPSNKPSNDGFLGAAPGSSRSSSKAKANQDQRNIGLGGNPFIRME